MAKKTVDPWVRTKEKGILPKLPDEVLAPGLNRFSMDVIAYLEKHHFFRYDEPNAKWHYAFPLGNGNMGVMPYGAPDAFFFSMSANDIWDRRPPAESNYPKGTFADLRRAFETNDKKLFERLKRKGEHTDGCGREASTAKPAGTLCLEVFPSALTTKFYQHLSLAHAETTYSFLPAGTNSTADHERGKEHCKVVAFVHSARNVLAISVDAGKDSRYLPPLGLSLWRNPDDIGSKIEIGKKGDIGWLRCTMPAGDSFVIAVGVNGVQTTIGSVGNKILMGVTPTNRRFEVFCALVTDRDSKDPVKDAVQLVAEAEKSGFAHLQETHRAWWAEYWRRGYVATPWKDVEKFWYYALYVQASMAKPGGHPPGLQGPWIRENYPAWNGDYHSNWNQQVLYWGQYTANRLENAEPLYRLYEEMLPVAKKESRAYFKTRGTRLPIAADPSGHELCRNIAFDNWPGSTGWIAQHYYWHYKYSGDRTFLEKHAYPMLVEAGRLFEDVFYKEKDGTLTIWPATHSEWGGDLFEFMGKNSTYDLSIAKATFAMLTECARDLGKDKEAGHWRDVLKRIAPYPTDEEGRWKEIQGLPPFGAWDWHLMFPVFPMGLVSPDLGDAKDRKEARLTWQMIKANHPKEIPYGGFVGIQVAASAARMRDGDAALQIARTYLKHVNPAGLIGTNAEFWLEVDAPPGYNLILNEMLLQSYGGIVRVFPALKDEKTAFLGESNRTALDNIAFHSLRAEGGFLVSAERRNGDTRYVIIKSLAGNDLTLRDPIYISDGIRIRDWDTKEVILQTPQVVEQNITFKTKRGHTYVIDSCWWSMEDEELLTLD